MELDYDKLVRRVLDFWNRFDCKSFTVQELRNEFNAKELATILCDQLFFEKHGRLLKIFYERVNNLKQIFSEEEAFELVGRYYNYGYFFKCLNDDQLLSLINEGDESLTAAIATYLKSDESKIRGFNLVKDSYLKVDFLAALESDELKFSYLKKVPKEYREYVISSFKDDKYKEKCIGPLVWMHGDIIAKFKDDNLKARYLKKYFKLISNDDKELIIASFQDKEYLLHFLVMSNDSVKTAVAMNCANSDDDELVDQIIQMISDTSELSELLSSYGVNEKIVLKYVYLIPNNKLFDVINNMSDQNKIKFLEQFSEKKKVEIIRTIHDAESRFAALGYLKDKKNIIDLIEHCDFFPEYNDKYEYIIDLYVEYYNLDKEKLLILVNEISLSVLKVIKNANIVKLLNTSKDTLKRIVNLFDIDNLKMNHSSMNNILNSLLQRKFRVVNSEIIFIFPSIMHAIEDHDREYIISKLNDVSYLLEINQVFLDNEWTLEEFCNLLLSKNEVAINCLHEVTGKYIGDKRDFYIKENLKLYFEKYTNNKYDKKDLMKYMITNYPVELIMSFFTMYTYQIDESFYNDDELRLLKNVDLIRNIILYKKNPASYGGIPDDVKNNFRAFESLFERFVANRSINAYPDVSIDRKISSFKDVKKHSFIDILMQIDVDKVNEHLFKDAELFDVFSKYWSQYKIAGWGNLFNDLLSDGGVSFSLESVANFIQYFGLAYETLKEKVDKKAIANISITGLLDLAACYSSESKKYSRVLGEENFKFIASNPSPNASTMLKEERINESLKVLKKIRNRKYVTIPSFDKDFDIGSGKTMSVVVGNFSNPINLTYGERTGSCMRIGGAGSSLFNFCLENDSGFHIRFSNPVTGKFVSRVSGFRNGNTVFLNELRYSEDASYTNQDVVFACKLVADELIRLSANSDLPIENVCVTPFYAMEQSGMKTINLGSIDPQKGMKDFYTDVSTASVVLSTSEKQGLFAPFKLGVRNLPKYNVQRDKVRTLYNRECQEYVAHLKSLDQHLSGIPIEQINVDVDESLVVCFAGEDWCVAVNKEGIISEYVMKNCLDNEKAYKEYQGALEYLKANYEREIENSNMFSYSL